MLWCRLISYNSMFVKLEHVHMSSALGVLYRTLSIEGLRILNAHPLKNKLYLIEENTWSGPCAHLLRIIQAVAISPFTVRYTLPKVRLVHAKKHFRAVCAVLRLYTTFSGHQRYSGPQWIQCPQPVCETL